jgi:hypothetical protein
MAEVADDLSDFRALNPRRGPRCDVCRIIGQMDDAQRDRVTRAIAAEDITDRAVVAWLEQQGFAFSVQAREGSVKHHRQNRHG